MQLGSAHKNRWVNQKSVRLILTTKDVAKLLGVTEKTVRHMVYTKRLVFTGDPLEDFKTLAELKLKRDNTL